MRFSRGYARFSESVKMLPKSLTSPFHGGNTGSNPVGDAMIRKDLLVLPLFVRTARSRCGHDRRSGKISGGLYIVAASKISRSHLQEQERLSACRYHWPKNRASPQSNHHGQPIAPSEVSHVRTVSMHTFIQFTTFAKWGLMRARPVKFRTSFISWSDVGRSEIAGLLYKGQTEALVDHK
jgi:hypothetical protein